MGSIGRYIVRTAFGAFALVLVSLTLVVWVTHALRDVDLVANQGQTIVTFIGITILLIPQLVVIIAPIALMIAAAYTLNKLNTDSEIIVMSASGMSPWHIFKPFLVVALIVTTLVGTLTVYVAPASLRQLRTLITKVRADLIANVIRPGRFTTVDGGQLTFHVRERRANGELAGIFIDDRRNPAQRSTFLAERGVVIENENGAFLILERGSVQQLDTKQPDPTIVLFDRYAFDMTQFSGADASPTFNPTERFVWDLLWPDPEEPYYKANRGRFRSEINDRLAAPLYPIVFTVLTFAILGAPRTSRQSRALSMLMAISAVAGLRIVAFAGVVFSAREPAFLALLYVGMGTALVGGIVMLSRGAVIEPPTFLVGAAEAVQRRFSRQPAPA